MRRRLAVFWLAFLLAFPGFAGFCLAQDSSAAPDIPNLTQRAQAGDLGAMMVLGDVYLEGRGIPRDLDAAIGWFASVAQTKDANALYQLSSALRERNKPGDHELALRYGLAASARAKESGSAAFQTSIQIQLGYIYDALNRFEEAVAAYEAARRPDSLGAANACETARGGSAEGEEIESFGALAQGKGASAVMSTLWQIADNSMAELMTDFYDGLIRQNLDKEHALRRAQLALIKGETNPQTAQTVGRAMTVVEDGTASTQNSDPPTSHPYYYWAAFILMGNWM